MGLFDVFKRNEPIQSDRRNDLLNAQPAAFQQKFSYKKGDVIAQKYLVVDTLGEGGCGTVYLVYYEPHDQVYALKTFKGEYLNNMSVIERFQKEAQIWIDLESHPYLVRAYWVNQYQNRLFIGMEWIGGTEKGAPNSLDQYLRVSPPDFTQSLIWAIQFCHGMEYAYSKGIKAHRDIKPANIMIDHNKNVRISDFGLAGVVNPGGEPGEIVSITNQYQTMAGTSMGTPAYMPPEQFVDVTSCDERSDIYSFGVVLYQLAAKGKLPFSTENSNHFWQTLKYLHSEGKVPALDSIIFPQITRCLAKEKKDRYKSFYELRIDLEIILFQLTGKKFVPDDVTEMGSSDWNNKGLSYNNLGRHEEAIKCFDKAIQLDPLNAGAWHNKSFSFIFLSKMPEALSCCNEALRINPSHAAALLNKSQLLAMSGELSKAVEYLAFKYRKNGSSHWIAN